MFIGLYIAARGQHGEGTQENSLTRLDNKEAVQCHSVSESVRSS